MISPLLANVYLCYVFDLWAERWRRREATGDMIMVRYADDIVRLAAILYMIFRFITWSGEPGTCWCRRGRTPIATRRGFADRRPHTDERTDRRSAGCSATDEIRGGQLSPDRRPPTEPGRADLPDLDLLVVLAATRQLLTLHPEAGGFRLTRGADATQKLNIMSEADGLVGAETFAALNPRNDHKLRPDLAKLAECTERHRYIFFPSPKFPGTERLPQFESNDIPGLVRRCLTRGPTTGLPLPRCRGRSRSTAWWSRWTRSEMARSQEARHSLIIVVAPTGFYSSDRRHASGRHTLSYFEAPAA